MVQLQLRCNKWIYPYNDTVFNGNTHKWLIPAHQSFAVRSNVHRAWLLCTTASPPPLLSVSLVSEQWLTLTCHNARTTLTIKASLCEVWNLWTHMDLCKNWQLSESEFLIMRFQFWLNTPIAEPFFLSVVGWINSDHEREERRPSLLNFYPVADFFDQGS